MGSKGVKASRHSERVFGKNATSILARVNDKDGDEDTRKGEKKDDDMEDKGKT